jgi:hypothetical protein
MKNADTGAAPMEVTYTTTMDDYVAFNRYRAKQWPLMWVIIVLGAITVIVIFVLVGAVIAFALTNWWILLGGLAAGVLGAALYVPLFWPYFNCLVRLQAERHGNYTMLGRTTLILSEDGLVEITKAARSEAKWVNMNSLIVDGDRTYIMVTGLSCALLPRYGFNDPRDYDAATEFAIEQMKRAGKPVT